MKILMIIPSPLSRTGGAEKQLNILTKELKKKKIKSIIFSNKVDNKIFFLIQIFFYILKFNKNIDIIHVHSLNSPALIASIAGKLFCIPTIAKITRNGKNSALNNYDSKFFGKIYLSLLKILIDKFICLNSFSKKELLSKNFNKKKIIMIPNGVEISKFKKNLDTSNYLVVGRLIQRKGVDEIIKAFKKVFKNKKKNLFIIGDGPEIDYLIGISKSLPSQSKVYFLKNRSNSYVLKKMEKCSYFIMNSNSEGLSNAMLEAMSRNLVIIVKKIKSNEDILKNNYNCLLFKNQFELEEILKKKKDICKISSNSHKSVSKDFNIKLIASKYISLYQDLVKQNNL